MNGRPELFWGVYSLAPLRAPGRLRSLGRALESEPAFAFTNVSRSFPAGRKLKGSLADLLGSYEGRLDPNQPEMWFLARQEAPVGDADIYIADDARLQQRDMPHEINARFKDAAWFGAQSRLGQLSTFLIRVADEADAFYAFCSSSDLIDQRARLLERSAASVLGRILKAGRVAEDLRRELPDVYWWNYFGPAYVQKWDGKLDGLGAHQESTPGGARVVLATETPFVLDANVKRLEDYAWKTPFYAALGDDTFMRSSQKQQLAGEAVPDFDAHRVAAGTAPAPGPAAPAPREQLLPRVVRLRDLSPDEAALEAARDDLVETEALELNLGSAALVSTNEILRWLEKRTNGAVSAASMQSGWIVYRNPVTAVIAAFEPHEGGVRLRLPWLRPNFFAREVMPVLFDLAVQFDLQLPLGTSTVAQLMEVWREGNEQAVSRSTQPLPYMDQQRSERWWLYQSRKPSLHERFGENVFVPSLVAVGPGRVTDDLQLHITWTDAIPLVLPECDLVTLLAGRKPSQFKILGTARYEDVRNALAPLLESIEVDGLGALQVLLPNREKEARHVFDELPTKPFDHVELEPATWVDVRKQ